ncbi:MAG: undecaprenyl-diphosphate phosphatase [Rhodospirillaceae bacterium]
MPTLHLAILALVQGITEFLPVSSSGHLVLVPRFLGWPDQGLVMDVAVHVGTLGAVLIYFASDIWAMAVGMTRALCGRRDQGGKLAGLVIVATLPVIGAGFALNHYMPVGFRGLEVIAWATLGGGVLLYIADQVGMTLRRMEHLLLSDAIVIGIAQALALVPGTSRSGITMTAARVLGMERRDAARFSMLLSIPAILGAGTLKGWELYKSGNAQLTVDAFMAAGLAFVAALIAVALMMAWLKRASFTPFVLYRIALGGVLLAVVYGYAG